MPHSEAEPSLADTRTCLSDDEKAHVQREIADLIDADFHNDFADVFATAVSIIEIIPQQANNEIRNALNHMARAQNAPTFDVATREIRLAKGHIERAKRDCLKLSIIHKRKQIFTALDRIEAKYGYVDGELRALAHVIEKKRRTALKAENRGAEGVSATLEDILVDCLGLEEKLLTRYVVPSAAESSVRRFIWKLRKASATIAIGVGCGVAASVLFAWFFDDNAAARTAIAGGIRAASKWLGVP